MSSKHYRIIGMMSGTSLDGLDLAYAELHFEYGVWHYELGPCTTLPYDTEFRERLGRAIELSPEDHARLDREYGTYLGEAALDFIRTNRLQPDAIGSHGHTSHHRPAEGVTYQLGDGAEIARITGITTVSDFRRQDVSLGGQGAPLVPIGDRLLFGSYAFCLNLGGISNISLEAGGNRIAYDIGMANLPLNFLCGLAGTAYDVGGNMARSGKPNFTMLKQLDELEYYRIPPPKSTGLEWIKSEVFPLLLRSKSSIEDRLHTVVLHNCRQICKSILSHHPSSGSSLLITGGGAHNTFFMETLEKELDGIVRLEVPEALLIDYKEALVFALLAALRLEGKINVLCSVTGSKRDSSSGSVHRTQ